MLQNAQTQAWASQPQVGGQLNQGGLNSWGQHNQANSSWGQAAQPGPGISWLSPNPDPGAALALDKGQLAATPEESLWFQNKFKALQGLPSSMYRFPIDVLLHINDALVRDENSARRMEADSRMSQNAEFLIANPRAVQQGWDDRLTRLHPLWFQGGPACSAQFLWSQARTILGNDGVQALASYDMDTVGWGGSVTAKGWLELANPASKNLQLKLFNMVNVSSVTGQKAFSLVDGDETTINMGESLKEITEFREFENCLTTARVALSYVHPWNKSIEAIEGFMRSSNYCAGELAGRHNRAALLTGFVNYVFGRNAAAWKNRGMFLSADDLVGVWKAWFSKQPCSVVEPERKERKDFKSFQRQKNNLCRRFNSRTGCGKREDDCKTAFGLKLRHLCNFRLQNGRVCEKNHARHEHK